MDTKTAACKARVPTAFSSYPAPIS